MSNFSHANNLKEIEISGSQLELSQENKVDEEQLSSQAAVAFRESTLKCVVSHCHADSKFYHTFPRVFQQLGPIADSITQL